MKIDGTRSSSDVNRKKDAKKTSSGDGVFKSMLGGGQEASETAGSGLSSGIASVDALLAAQSMDDGNQKKSKKRMQERADNILEKLKDLKVAMVSGRVTVGHMISIADVVASHREKINDPHLSSILDEIDLRAHVELAKLQVAQSKSR